MTKDMQEFLKDSMNLTVSIGVSDFFHNYSNISHAHKEALKAIDRSFTYPTGSIIMYKDIKNIDSVNAGIPLEAELSELENMLKSCNYCGIQEAFSKLQLKIIDANNVSRKYINGVCHILILLHQDKDSKTIILKAKQFINKHFCEDISLEAVAGYLGLSAGYFSRLFSKETGESFINYAIHLRIELAKELLKTTKYKVYEVSEMVGYDNAHYFSRIFKKVTGISPADYKDGIVS